MIYAGCDPGAKGAWAIINDDGQIIVKSWDVVEFVEDMRLLKGKECVLALEKVGARPGQGVTSMFNFGKLYGFVQGVITANYIPYQLVSPQTWKKEYGLSKDKNASIEVCQRLFPNVNLYRTERCKKPDDGMAESLLLAEYARRKF